MEKSKYHVIANELWPVFTVHTKTTDVVCHVDEQFCRDIDLSDEDYQDYLDAMAKFKAIQDKICFPVT